MSIDGPPPAFFAAWLLTCMTVIVYADLRWLIIPNAANALLLAGGIAFRLQEGLLDTATACISGLFIFTTLWLLRRWHNRVRGRIGLGLGDVKFMAIAGIWLDPALYPAFLFFASFPALAFALSTTRGEKLLDERRIPFGPFLAGALTVTWAFERHLLHLLGYSS